MDVPPYEFSPQQPACTLVFLPYEICALWPLENVMHMELLPNQHRVPEPAAQRSSLILPTLSLWILPPYHRRILYSESLVILVLRSFFWRVDSEGAWPFEWVPTVPSTYFETRVQLFLVVSVWWNSDRQYLAS